MAHHKSSDPNIFILPDLGEGVHEAELIKWRVTPGQTVKEHDILAEMETDKALVEVPSPRPGTIKILHGSEGEILHVGNALVTYEGGTTNGTGHAAPVAAPAPKPKDPAPSEEREDAGTVVGMMKKEEGPEPGKALATPAVRRLARDLGVDIDTVVGTGIGGRVTEKDVRGHQAPAARAAAPVAPAPAARPAPAATPAVRQAPIAPPPPPADLSAAVRISDFAAPDETTRIPFRGVRRTIANRLRESINQAVHFTVMDEADVSVLDGLRKKLAAASGERVSFLPFVAAAVCRVLGMPQFRAMNATVDEKPGDPSAEASILQHRSVHLGIATDTDNGLMVPVIKDADKKGVYQISTEMSELAKQARDGKLSPADMSGGCFSISSLGGIGGRYFTPIINAPEVAIMGVCKSNLEPRWDGKQFVPRLMLPLSLSWDHRVIDGAAAARFNVYFGSLLTDFRRILL